MILSEDQTMIRNMTRRFANERLAPRSSECDRTKHFP